VGNVDKLLWKLYELVGESHGGANNANVKYKIAKK